MSIDQLNECFAIKGAVEFVADKGGLPCAVVQTDLAEGRIFLHGAHLAHYQPRGQRPVLFMSEKSAFEPGKPIRGGVPLVFPWFGPRNGDPQAPMHGLARLMSWKLQHTRLQPDGAVELSFTLASGDATRPIWSNDFALRYQVIIGTDLRLALEVQNTSAESFTFEEAMHTYLAVSDVRQVSIGGLGGRAFVDRVGGVRRGVQEDPILRITAETDRIYLDEPGPVTVADPAAGRRLVVEKEGSLATVVWNPWIAKAKAMPDFGDEEWPDMLCIESCNVWDHAVNLPAGQTHRMGTRIAILPL